jgi:hypothetical protein
MSVDFTLFHDAMPRPTTVAAVLLILATVGGVGQLCAATPPAPRPMACCQNSGDAPSCCCQQPAENAPAQPAAPAPTGHAEHAALASSVATTVTVAASSPALIEGGRVAHDGGAPPTYLDNCTFRC